MRIDIREKINGSFLYKRFAYNSEGFIALMKFLERENLIDDFCNECNLKRPRLENELKVYKRNLTLWGFFHNENISFSFRESRKGFDFWYKKIFENKNFQKIENKLL